MSWTVSRHSWLALAGFAFMACAPELPETESGHTTTTYGGTNSNSSASTDSADGAEVDTGDGVPPDPSDSGPDPSDSGPDPTDSGPDPTDSGPPPILDLPPEPGLPDGATCSWDGECSSGHCYIVPFLGGYCGECTGDADCVGGGCSPPSPFAATGSHCNMGEPGGGCESDAVCAGNLRCSTVLDLLGLIELNTCGSCLTDLDCNGLLCAPSLNLAQWAGQRECMSPGSLPQDAFCELSPSSGNEVCESGICSTIDIMGLAEIGACGECNVDADCGGGTCIFGEFVLDTGTLVGSTCQ